MGYHKKHSAAGITNVSIWKWPDPVDHKLYDGTQIEIDTDAKVSRVQVSRSGGTLIIEFPQNLTPGQPRLTVRIPRGYGIMVRVS